MDAAQADQLPRFPFEYHRTVVNHGRESCNAAFNAAARVSSGSILFLEADDCFPPADWDRLLIETVYRANKTLDDDFVIWVSTGGPNDDRLMTVPILSRRRFLTKGYAIWPYPSVYADNDFTESARADGVVIDARASLRFEHRHFSLPGGLPRDEVYDRQNSRENYAEGERIFQERRALGFPPLSWYWDRDDREADDRWEYAQEREGSALGECKC
jgi:hypothetical protein